MCKSTTKGQEPRGAAQTCVPLTTPLAFIACYSFCHPHFNCMISVCLHPVSHGFVQPLTEVIKSQNSTERSTPRSPGCTSEPGVGSNTCTQERSGA